MPSRPKLLRGRGGGGGVKDKEKEEKLKPPCPARSHGTLPDTEGAKKGIFFFFLISDLSQEAATGIPSAVISLK